MAGHRNFELSLRIGREQVRLSIRIPEAPLSLVDLLPLLNSLTELTTAVAGREAAAAGRPVRCAPGCGACCRQLVPIAPAEAIALRATIAGLEPRHRERVEARFTAATRQFLTSGLTEQLAASDPTGRDRPQVPVSRRRLGLEYFAQAIPCPFLEQESCSIHPHRPLACREYLVASDPSHCARPASDTVAVVELPRRLSQLLLKLGAELAPEQPRWLPLSLALQSACFNEALVAQARQPGPLLFERIIAWLTQGGSPDGGTGKESSLSTRNPPVAPANNGGKTSV